MTTEIIGPTRIIPIFNAIDIPLLHTKIRKVAIKFERNFGCIITKTVETWNSSSLHNKPFFNPACNGLIRAENKIDTHVKLMIDTAKIFHIEGQLFHWFGDSAPSPRKPTLTD
jgi:hypothetical protein